MKNTFNNICDDAKSTLVALDGEKRHVHLLVNYPPKVSISKLVNSLKGASSPLLRRDFEKEISKILYKGVPWSPSYFASSCGGAPLEIVKQYIKDQKTPLK